MQNYCIVQFLGGLKSLRRTFKGNIVGYEITINATRLFCRACLCVRRICTKKFYFVEREE